jgi:hypothetical protein
VLRAVAEHHPPPPRAVRPELPAALSHLIEQLLAKDPDRRPASAREVADTLRAVAAAGAGEPATASWRPAPVPPPRRRSWAFPRTTALAVSLGLLLAAGLSSWFWLKGHEGVGGGGGSAVVPGPTRAAVDMRVWPSRRRLSEPRALPLKPGDQFRIEATADRPAYLYLFWIDSEGKVVPVYPWNPRVGWGTRPAEERPVTELELPPTATSGYKITGDQPGMETLILVARAERLTLTDLEVRSWFIWLPPPRPFQDPESAVWFENGRIVTGDAGRRTRGFEETAINDPVLRVQAVLKERIGPHADCTAAVSFARLGRGE